MSLQENRDFLAKQRELFQNLLAQSRASVDRQTMELAALSSRITRLLSRSRALQDALSSSSATPSAAAIQERVELQARADSLSKIADAFSDLLARFEDLRDEYRQLRSEEAQLPPAGLLDTDSRRLDALRDSIRAQLADYGFSTFHPSEIDVSPDTYRPVREGFEIGFEMSASDAIRLKWAYQLALLEVASRFDGTHHPGILMLDEPRQQETAPISFHTLLARASRVPDELQIIFTSSEDKAPLREAVRDLEINLVDIPGYLLTRDE